MKWTNLETPDELTAIKSSDQFSIIFKHSTRCAISMMAKKRFELDWESLPENINLYFLDLLRFRELSNVIATDFDVFHQSPQLLLVKDGQCIYEASHGDISVEEALEQIGVSN